MISVNKEFFGCSSHTIKSGENIFIGPDSLKPRQITCELGMGHAFY